MIAKTPDTPYYAMIFTSVKSTDLSGYDEMATKMAELTAQQPGFLGMEHATSDSLSITVCYWSTLESITAWKQDAEHAVAQQTGKERWYQQFATRIMKVERDNFFEK